MQLATRFGERATRLLDWFVPPRVHALGREAVFRAYSVVGSCALVSATGVLFLAGTEGFPENWTWVLRFRFAALAVIPFVLRATRLGSALHIFHPRSRP